MTRHNIRPEIVHLATPVSELVRWPGNPRRGDLADLAEKLALFGQYQPIIAQASTQRIVVGNHRYEAATDRLGWTHIAALQLDLDDDTAAKLLLADNRSSDGGAYVTQLLAQFLGSLDSLDGTGWTFDEYDDLIAELDEQGRRELQQALPPTSNLGASPIIHDELPATDARYAETPEAEAERAARVTAITPRAATGLTEMVVVYSVEERAEAARLIDGCRDVLGSDAKTGDVVLRALRVMTAVVDSLDDPSPLTIAALCKHAGLG